MSTSTIKTDGNNDIFIDGNGNMVILSDIDAVVQDVRSNCLMRKGEDIYDVNSGVDYFRYIFTPQQSYDGARKSIADAILASPEVTGITSLGIEISGDVFQFEAQIKTTYGPTKIGG